MANGFIAVTMVKRVYQRNDNGELMCPHCPFTAAKANASTMHYHVRKHEEKFTHTCQHCEFKTFFQNKLDYHMAAKHPDVKQETQIHALKCPFPNCTFQSLTKGNCLIHFMRKHCKQEVEQLLGQGGTCRNCGQEFQSNTAFQYHASSCIRIPDVPKTTMLRTILAY